MSRLSGNELRTKYLNFFKNKNHVEIPSASLVPQNDPTTLFTSSGMQPMIPYLLGESHPEGTRIVDSQRCFRAEDIEEVGDNRHTTIFEMLGNWSLGDYFKKEQLTWMFEFLTKEIKLDPNRLFVSVFEGNNEVPQDNEAVQIWQELFKQAGIDASVVKDAAIDGMQNGRIFYYNERKNWWSRSGVPSKMPILEPGGPDSEIFYEFTQVEHNSSFGKHCHPNCDCGHFIEIGNNVFMQYQKQTDGTFNELQQRNIDFGGGLERMLCAANDNPDVFTTDLFLPLVKKLEQLSSKRYDEYKKEFQIIADHIKAAVMLASDGVIPSNKTQGYMMRRLIRRAINAGNTLGIKENFTHILIREVQSMYSHLYPQVQNKAVHETITQEVDKFQKTLEVGLKELRNFFIHKTEMQASTYNLENYQQIASYSFDFYQSRGLPSDIFLDEWSHSVKNLTLDDRVEIQSIISQLQTAHQDLSRSSSAGMFKGGLADNSEIVTQYHSTTHLLHQALRDVVGAHIAQKGSNITSERLRFDFSHSQRLTKEQIQNVEEKVNQKIKESLPMYYQIMPLELARKTGAIGLFGEKYPEVVKIYSIGKTPQITGDEPADSLDQVVPRNEVYSREFCGGPHVSNTSEIKGNFKIIKDEKISKDVVRIKAVLECI
ncbi:MAG: alanine--tRNA ligase [bacterium]|nr:alanine--tRNA ligase [bacterium]